MEIIQMIDKVKLNLSKYPSINFKENINQINTSKEEINKVEEYLGFIFPQIHLLKYFIEVEKSRVSFINNYNESETNGLYWISYDDEGHYQAH